MNPNYPDDINELQNMLNKGMGRAICFLLEQTPRQYREMILDACLHNYAYDRQIEDTRAEYLYPLIEASSEKDYYLTHILQAIPQATDAFDAEQLLDFLVLFANDGCITAKDTLYKNLQSRWAEPDFAGYEQTVELDGSKGLIFCLGIIGANPRVLPNYEISLLIRKAEEKSDIETVRLALKEASEKDSAIVTALDAVEDYSVEWTADEIAYMRDERVRTLCQLQFRPTEKTTWDEVKNSPEYDRLVFHWPQVASDSEFENAARDFMPNAIPLELSNWVRIFWKRQFPFEPTPLIQLVDYPNDRVKYGAFSALEIVKHPDVRRLYESLLQESRLLNRAFGLLRSNYQRGDYAAIIDILEKETDPDILHNMCLNIIHVYQDNHVLEGVEPLLMVYEKDPCSVCRFTCLGTLQKTSELSDWMVEECKYDSDTDTRKLAFQLSA